jgi:hypothetical protein
MGMHGMLIPMGGGGGPVVFPWNPEMLNGPNIAPQYAQIDVAGKESPYLQFANGGPQELSFDLHVVRNMSPADCWQLYTALEGLTKPVKQGPGPAAPPKVQVILGPIRGRYVVTAVGPKFGRVFNPNSLDPEEAVISVKLTKYIG